MARPVTWLDEARALFLKDLRAELRTRVAISSIGVFALSSLFLITVATAALKETKAINPGLFFAGLDSNHTAQASFDAALYNAWDSPSKMALMWVLICFAAFAGLSHSFVHEEETGTTMALRLSMSAQAVYTGKLIFNFMVLVGVSIAITPLYMLITGMPAGSPIVLVLMMLSGCVGLAGAATIVAALAAKAHGTGALYGAVGLPLLLVFLFLLLNAAQTLYSPHAPLVQIVKDVGGLLSYGVALIGVSALTFHFVWEE